MTAWSRLALFGARGWILVTVITVAAVLAACGGDDEDSVDPDVSGGVSTQPPGVSPSITATVAANETSRKIAALSVPSDLVDGLAVGKKDAPATLQVFEDFQCPNCLSYTANYEQLIIDEYVKTGKLRYEFHNFAFLGQESVYAAAGTVCAGKQNKFWEFHEKLFLVQADANQLRAEKIDVGRFDPDALVEYATEVGMDRQAFITCLEDPATVQAVQADAAAARTAGLRGTPGFVLNGTAVAYPRDAAAFRQLLDDATKK